MPLIRSIARNVVGAMAKALHLSAITKPNKRATKPAENEPITKAARVVSTAALVSATPKAPPAPANDERSNAVLSGNSNDPVDLLKPLRSPATYPIDAFGSFGAKIIRATAEDVQCPPAMVGQTVLAAMSLAAQGHIDVEMRRGDARPVSIVCATVAPSSVGKSSSERRVMQGAHRAQHVLRRDAMKRLAEYRKIIRLDPDLEHDLPRPHDGTMLIQDCTYDGLLKTLENGLGSAGLFNDDAADFLFGFGMKEENRMRFAGGFSKLWDGSSIQKSLVMSSSHITGKRLVSHLQMQPSVAASFVTNRDLVSHGFLARFLVVWLEGYEAKVWRNTTDENASVFSAFDTHLYDRLMLPLQYQPGTVNELLPRTVGLSPGAQKEIEGFFNDIHRQRNYGERFENTVEFAGKATENAGRIAGTLAWMQDPSVGEISAETMEAAIELMRFHLDEVVRIFDAAKVDPLASKLQRLLQWIHRKEFSSVSNRDINRSGPQEWRNDIKSLTAALDELTKLGYLQQISKNPTRQGTYEAAYEVVRRQAPPG